MRHEERCPNFAHCGLVNNPGFPLERERIEQYMVNYCRTGMNHLQCKRFAVREELGFCPNFVLPDTADDLNSIIEKFDASLDEE